MTSLILDSIPLIFLAFSYMLINLTTVYAMAFSQDTVLLAGYGLGYTLWTSSVFAPILSMNAGFYTMASQAFGAKQIKLTGLC